MTTKMGWTDAVLALMEANAYQGDSITRRVSDYKRALRAMDVLCITSERDRRAILDRLEFIDSVGQPLPWLRERLPR